MFVTIRERRDILKVHMFSSSIIDARNLPSRHMWTSKITVTHGNGPTKFAYFILTVVAQKELRLSFGIKKFIS